MTLPERRQRRPELETAAARLAQVAFVVQNYRELVNRFNDMKFITLDLETGVRVEADIEDPEFGYQMLGIVKSLLGALEPLVNPEIRRSSR